MPVQHSPGALTPRKLFGRSGKEYKDPMCAVGRINREHGKEAIGLAATGTQGEREWTMERQKRSLRHATRWDELPVAHA